MVERWSISAGALVLALWPLGEAHAQAPPAAPNPVVIEMYTAAWAARNEGRWDVACTKFQEALAIEATPAIVINVGDCHEHAGQVATALADYERARLLNQSTADLTRKADIEGEIAGRVIQVRPRVPKMRIDVAPRVAGVVVKLDGKVVPAGALGVEQTLDPGKHEVTVAAAGYRSERRAVDVKEGTSVPVTFSLVSDAPPEVSHTGSIALGATAVVLAGVGLGLGAGVLSRHGQLAEMCAEGAAACQDEAEGQKTQATVANVLFGLAGAAAVGAGVFFFVVERPDGKKAEVGLSLQGASVRGVW